MTDAEMIQTKIQTKKLKFFNFRVTTSWLSLVFRSAGFAEI